MPHTKRRFNKNKSNRRNRTHKRGGFLGSLYKKQPETTQDKLDRQKKEFGHIKLKHFKEIITKKINELPELRRKCIDVCKRTSLERKDERMIKQVESMISEKTDYEWSNTCSNGFKLSECRDYINAMSEVEYYVGQLKLLNEIVQRKYGEYKESIKPIQRDSIASTVTNSDVGSDVGSDMGSDVGSDMGSNDSQLV